MNLFMLFLPIGILLLGIISVVVPISILAKARGDVRSMSSGTKKLLIGSAFLPLAFLGLFMVFMSTSVNGFHKKLAADIQSGAVKVYTIDTSGMTDTQTETYKDASGAPYLSFKIFAHNLYVDQKNANLSIRTKEFQGDRQITHDAVGAVWFERQGGYISDANGEEAYLKKEGKQYTRTETARGTVFEVQEPDLGDSNSGSFLYVLYFAHSDYILFVRIDYVAADDLRIRYTPVIPRVYAQTLYNLITSTLQVDPTKLQAAYDLQPGGG